MTFLRSTGLQLPTSKTEQHCLHGSREEGTRIAHASRCLIHAPESKPKTDFTTTLIFQYFLQTCQRSTWRRERGLRLRQRQKPHRRSQEGLQDLQKLQKLSTPPKKPSILKKCSYRSTKTTPTLSTRPLKMAKITSAASPQRCLTEFSHTAFSTTTQNSAPANSKKATSSKQNRMFSSLSRPCPNTSERMWRALASAN